MCYLHVEVHTDFVVYHNNAYATVPVRSLQSVSTIIIYVHDCFV